MTSTQYATNMARAFMAAEMIMAAANSGASIDARARIVALAQERSDADDRCRTLLAQLVRERTFYELERRLSPAVKSALVEFVRALAKLGAPIDAERILAGNGEGDSAVGRPAIAAALVAAGHVRTTREAFDRFLGTRGAAFVPRTDQVE